MAQGANIVVKKNDNVTDITYTFLEPGNGAGQQAVWKSTSVGTAPNHQPELRYSAKSGKAMKGVEMERRLRVTYVYPEISTNTTTGITSVVNKAFFAGEWTIPVGMAASAINESVSQLGHALASAHMKAQFQSLYGAT